MAGGWERARWRETKEKGRRQWLPQNQAAPLWWRSHSYFGGVNFLPILGNCRHAHLSGMSQASPACDCRIRSHSFELLKFTPEKVLLPLLRDSSLKSPEVLCSEAAPLAVLNHRTPFLLLWTNNPSGLHFTRPSCPHNTPVSIFLISPFTLQNLPSIPPADRPQALIPTRLS